MKETLKLAVRLMLFALVAALLLAVVNDLTKDKIAENTAAKVNAARVAVIGECEFEPVDTTGTEFKYVTGVFAAKQNGETVGYVYEMESKGYGGIIRLSTGIAVDGTITGVAVSSHSETKGLGTDAQTPFLERFIGENAANEGGVQVDGMTGATVSSTAVKVAMNEAVEHFKNNYAGEGDAQ